MVYPSVTFLTCTALKTRTEESSYTYLFIVQELLHSILNLLMSGIVMKHFLTQTYIWFDLNSDLNPTNIALRHSFIGYYINGHVVSVSLFIEELK